MTRYRNPGEAIGALNRADVRRWFREHLCGTQRECAAALGLSPMAVSRHVASIRAEWRQEAYPALQPGRCATEGAAQRDGEKFRKKV